VPQIQAVHTASRSTYGSRRVHAGLRLGRGILVGYHAVEMGSLRRYPRPVESIRVFRMRSGVAAAAAASVLYYVGAAARSEQIRVGWSTLATRGVMLTAVAGVAAILVGLYGVLLAAPPKTKLWSWVATAMAVLALAGFAVGQVCGWWHRM
jgi:hypothetical protein